MSRVVLYHYLKNKGDLLEPRYIREMKKDLEQFQAVLGSQVSSGEKIKTSIQLLVKRATTRPLDFALSSKHNQDLPEDIKQTSTELQ